MITLIFLAACATKNIPAKKPLPIKEDAVHTAKGLDAYMTKLSIEVAKSDGTVTDSERLLIFKENGSGFDPILFHAIDQTQGVEFVAETKRQLHLNGSKRDLDKAASEWTFVNVFTEFLNRVALADEEMAQAEQKKIAEMLAFIHRIDPDGSLRTEADALTWGKEVFRGELPLILNTIKSLQHKQKQAHGSYVAFQEQPPRNGSGESRSWQPSLESDEQAFPLQINTKIRGSYRVTVSDNGFEAYGVIDSDGDGEFATYMATSGAPPVALTAKDIY